MKVLMFVLVFFLLTLQADIQKRYGLFAKDPDSPKAKRHYWCRFLFHQIPRVCHLPAEVCPPCSPFMLPHLLFPVCEGGLLAQQTLCTLPARNSRGLPRAACSAFTWRTESSSCRCESNWRDTRWFLWRLCVVLWRANGWWQYDERTSHELEEAFS